MPDAPSPRTDTSAPRAATPDPSHPPPAPIACTPMPNACSTRDAAVSVGDTPNLIGAAAPRPSLAAFGPMFELVIRSYAPFEAFGDIPISISLDPAFKGDARGPSTDPNATARITSVVRLDTRSNTIESTAFSNESAFALMGLPKVIRPEIRGTAQPGVSATMDLVVGDVLRVVVHHWGSMPLAPRQVTPDIDLHTEFLLSLGADGSLLVTTTMRGDAFPNAEAFVRLGDGRTILLHHWETPAGRFGPYYMLPMDEQRPMGTTNVTVPETAPDPAPASP